MTNNTLPPLHSLRWSGMSHNGRFRKNNEDAFLALTFDEEKVQYLGKEGDSSLESGDFVFAVSDGMGGANAGEFASKIAVQMITKRLLGSFDRINRGIIEGGQDHLVDIFSHIHNEMLQMSNHYEECRGMGATLSLCWVTPGKTYFAHVGDSRIYHLPAKGEIKQISHDHTHIGWLLRNGKITPHEARTHPSRNQLLKVLGGKQDHVEPQIGSIDLQLGDRLILCSDGVSDDISDQNIEYKVRNHQSEENPSVAHSLIDEALFNSGEDNLTALIVEAYEE